MEEPSFQLTDHARKRLHERRIRALCIDQTIQRPDREESDPNDPDLVRAYRRIHEAGDQVLRVVYDPRKEPVLIITVLFESKPKRSR
jgi:hypothetical protein